MLSSTYNTVANNSVVMIKSINRSTKVEVAYKPARSKKRALMIYKPTYLEFSFDDMV